MDILWQIWATIQINLEELLNLDWQALQFKQEYFAVRAAVVILAALLLAVLWKKWRKRGASFLEHSGYAIGKKDPPGLLGRILNWVPKMLLVVAASLTLAAVADPYTLENHQISFQQSREIAYLRDTSASMGWRYKNTNKSRAEIVQDFILKLIASRKDHKDRAFYVTFASAPRLIADFTTDNESLLFSVAMGPLVTADPSVVQNPKFVFKLREFEQIEHEGGTDLLVGLGSVVKLFNERGDKKVAEEIKKNPSVKRRSVIIVTDGASQSDPEPQFKELRKRNIIPYLVFVEPDLEEERIYHGDDSPQLKMTEQLLKLVRQYGGISFLATDEDSLGKVLKRLDTLHALVTDSRVNITENHIYQLPLTVAIFFYFLAVVFRLLLWKFHEVV